MSRFFHFTLGPVQGFVAQARRTRDFWAGSFLLSWLSSIAMLAVREQGGRIVFPEPDPRFMAAIRGELAQGEAPPRYGNVPNRFMAEVGPAFEPLQVVDSVRQAWTALADLVYERDLGLVAGPETRAIWNRQVSTFWDMAWGITDSQAESALLDRIKNWRVYLPPDQPGLKCMMMDGWQELSAAPAPGNEARSFWEQLRSNGAPGMRTDLREGEWLCAIGFLKRRFSRYFAQLEMTMNPPAGTAFRINGWSLPADVPSVHYLAAAHWLEDVLAWASRGVVEQQAVEAFHDAAHELTGAYGEWSSNIRCIAEAPGKHRWKALDGSACFAAMLDNPRLWDDPKKRARASAALNALCEKSELGAPQPFWAVLAMDGDQLGKYMAQPMCQEKISLGLGRFVDRAKDIIWRHNGFVIFVGGDDVLAVFPVDDALPAAAALRDTYRDSLASAGVPASISAAIVYAHCHVPLSRVLNEAHMLLEDVAKERTGRDAVACRLWKPGNAPQVWSQPWHVALDDTGCVRIRELATWLNAQSSTDEENSDSRQSHSFIYRLRERLMPLAGSRASGMGMNQAQLQEIALAEYLTTPGLSEISRREASESVEALLLQCMEQVRSIDEEGNEKFEPTGRFMHDGLMLLRFLAAHTRARRAG